MVPRELGAQWILEAARAGRACWRPRPSVETQGDPILGVGLHSAGLHLLRAAGEGDCPKRRERSTYCPLAAPWRSPGPELDAQAWPKPRLCPAVGPQLTSGVPGPLRPPAQRQQ